MYIFILTFIEPYGNNKLDEIQEHILNVFKEGLENNDESVIEECYDMRLVDYEVYDELKKLALDLCSANNMNIENINSVQICHSAIELTHFCRNENYKANNNILNIVPLGYGLFWEQIVPLVLNISEQIGCKYLYLFAADKSEKLNDKAKQKSLISYYNSLNFDALDKMSVLQPKYDKNCFPMYQEINDLQLERKFAWLKYSDLFDNEAQSL